MSTTTRLPQSARVYRTHSHGESTSIPASCSVHLVDDLEPPLFARHLLFVLIDDAAPIDPFAHITGFVPAKAPPGAPIGSTTAVTADTPTITNLANTGLRFNSYRTSALCSPTRSSFCTGVHPFRHGVGTVIRAERYGDLFEFGDSGYDSFGSVFTSLLGAGIKVAFVGKIHQALWSAAEFKKGDAPGSGRFGMGWPILDRIVGPQGTPGLTNHTHFRNLNQQPVPGGGPDSTGGYRNYFANATHLDNGAVPQTEYVTSFQASRVIDFFNSLAADDRGFAYWACTAQHSPFGAAGDFDRDMPEGPLLATAEYKTRVDRAQTLGIPTTWPQYMSYLEAVDVELTRVLASIPAHIRSTLTVVISPDNGVEAGFQDGRKTFVSGDATMVQKDLGAKWNQITDEDIPRTKETPYNLGTGGWAIWNGPGRGSPVLGTAGTHTWAMAHDVDWMPTICRYFDVSPPPSDGKDLTGVIYDGLPRASAPRQESLGESFYPTGNWRNIEAFPFRGQWAVTTSYALNDIVIDNGETEYLCIQAHTATNGNRPTAGGSGPDAFWLGNGYTLERGYHAYLSGYTTPSVELGNGKFSLVRKRIQGAWVDELYRLLTADDVVDDYFEIVPLDLVTYADQYAEMLAKLNALLDSTLGGTVLAITEPGGAKSFIRLNDDLSLPVTELGVPGALMIMPTTGAPIGLPVTQEGDDAVIPYEGTDVQSGWAIGIDESSGLTPNVPHILLDPSNRLIITDPNGETSFIQLSGSNPPQLDITGPDGAEFIQAIAD